MFSGDYASVVNWMAKMYENNVDDIDRIHAIVLLERIVMRDRTSQCNSLNYEEANELIDWISCNLMRTQVLI